MAAFEVSAKISRKQQVVTETKATGAVNRKHCPSLDPSLDGAFVPKKVLISPEATMFKSLAETSLTIALKAGTSSKSRRRSSSPNQGRIGVFVVTSIVWSSYDVSLHATRLEMVDRRAASLTDKETSFNRCA
jgi:hypothetical protein